jgi:hypothetical protein
VEKARSNLITKLININQVGRKWACYYVICIGLIHIL